MGWDGIGWVGIRCDGIGWDDMIMGWDGMMVVVALVAEECPHTLQYQAIAMHCIARSS